MVKKNVEKISHHLVEIDCTTVHSIKRNEPEESIVWVRGMIILVGSVGLSGLPKVFLGVVSMGLATGAADAHS